jgi:hypothetical protein
MAKQEYKFSASFQVIGGFWEFPSPDKPFAGTLTAKNGQVTLATAPTYSKGNALAEFRKAFLAVNQQQSLSRIESFCGFTSAGDCTLLSSLRTNEDGQVDTLTNQSVVSQHYRASTTVIGFHLESGDAKCIESAAFYYTNTEEYLPPGWSFQLLRDETIYTSPRQARNVFQFFSTDLDAEVICEVFAGGDNQLLKGATIKSVPRIRIVPKQPQSLEWYLINAIRIENFFSLFLGTSVYLDMFQVFIGDKTGWVVQQQKRQNAKPERQLWITLAPSVLGGALDKWLGVPVDKQPIETTVLGVLRKSSLFMVTEFLSLAQAFEGFNRLQGGSGNKSFAQRLGELYDMLSLDFAKRVVGDRQTFIATVKDTRNYFTHLGLPAKSSVITDDGSLFDWNQRLQSLIRFVMLLQIGISESDLKGPIAYQSTRWKLR